MKNLNLNRTQRRLRALQYAILGATLIFLGCSGGGTTAQAPTGSQCPNIFENGSGVEGEVCTGPTDCGCGLFCKGGSCAPYEGSNAGCICDPNAPTDTVTSNDTSTPDTTTPPEDTGPDINAGCDKAAPEGSGCNPYCQIGCADNEQCTFLGWGMGCTGIGEFGIGNVCNGYDSCQVGHACFSLNNDPQDVCRQFCITDGDCPEGRKCSQGVNFSTGGTSTFCGDPTIGCNTFGDPVEQCGEGNACYLVNNATKCLPAGTLALGEVCRGKNESCAPGLQCAIVCTEICSIDTTNADAPNCVDTCDQATFLTLDEPNGIGICLGPDPNKMCDMYLQDCPAGEACYPTQEGWACIQEGSIEKGDPCTFTNDCVEGTICVNSTCHQACNLKEDATPESSCSEICEDNGSLNPSEWGLGFCKDAELACDFWLQDCPEDGQVCYISSSGASCIPQGGGAGLGASCSGVDSCAQGLACHQGSCVKPCNISGFSSTGGTLPPEVDVCDEDCGDTGYTAPWGAQTGAGLCN